MRKGEAVTVLMHALEHVRGTEDEAVFRPVQRTLDSLALDVMNPDKTWEHREGCICQRCR